MLNQSSLIIRLVLHKMIKVIQFVRRLRTWVFPFAIYIGSFLTFAQNNSLSVQGLHDKLKDINNRSVKRELLVIHNLTFPVYKFEYQTDTITFYYQDGTPNSINYPTLQGYLLKTESGYLLFDGFKKITDSKRVILFDTNFIAKAVYHFIDGNLFAISIFDNFEGRIKEKICLANNMYCVYPLEEFNFFEISNIQFALDLFHTFEASNHYLNKFYYRLWEVEDFKHDYFLFY